MTPRNIFGALGLAAILAFSFYFQHIRDKAQQLDVTVALLESERTTFATWKTGQKERDDATKDHQSELAGLRADLAARPAPVIRLCPPTAAPGTSKAVATGSATPAATTGSIQPGASVPEPAGADVGPFLQQLFARSDELSAQVRAIVNYMGEPRGN